MAKEDHLLHLVEAIRQLQFAMNGMGPNVALAEVRLAISRDLISKKPTLDARREFERAIASSPTYVEMMRNTMVHDTRPPNEICQIAGVRILAPPMV